MKTKTISIKNVNQMLENIKNTIIISCLLLLFSSNALAKANQLDSIPHHLPLKISILDESISFPNFWFLDFSFNPTIMLGTEIILKEKNNHDWHLTGNLGYYFHKDWQAAIFLNSEIGFRHHFGKFNISPRFGLGYAHTFATKAVYRPVDGQFEKVKDFGSPTFTPSLSINIGYQFKDAKYSPEIFLTFMSSLEIPFTIHTGIHQFVGLGYKFYPF